MSGSWVEGFGGSVTVVDREGIILEMNGKAGETFQKYGGRALIGKNVLDCHPGASRRKLQEMLGKQTINCYTIESDGIKKLIYQSPWYCEGEYMGFVELGLELFREVHHFVRK